MARKPGTRAGGEFVMFDVIYEDGTQRSNRRVPADALGGLDGDEPANVPSSRRRTARSPNSPACRPAHQEPAPLGREAEQGRESTR